jgi:transposase
VGSIDPAVTPDNAKAMISQANRYEPRSNDTVLDFARHYGTSILLARPYHPRDKAKAESAVVSRALDHGAPAPSAVRQRA